MPEDFPDGTVALAYCPLLAHWIWEIEGCPTGPFLITCDEVDCTHCARMGEFLGEHSRGHAWVCYACADGFTKRVGFWVDGYCDICGGTIKGPTVGEIAAQDITLQLVEINPGLIEELQRLHSIVEEHYVPPDSEVR
jgi:hypothetical protein